MSNGEKALGKRAESTGKDNITLCASWLHEENDPWLIRIMGSQNRNKE